MYHNYCFTAIQDSSSIHHRLNLICWCDFYWLVAIKCKHLQLFAMICDCLQLFLIICDYLQLFLGVWDDRRSCAWLGSPSLWLGEGKHSCLNIVFSLVEILYQYMFQYLTNVCSNISFCLFFENNIDIWLNISPIFCIEGGGPRDDHRDLRDDHQDHNSSPGKSLSSSLSILSSS